MGRLVPIARSRCRALGGPALIAGAVLVGFLAGGCAARSERVKEPLLTHPPRHAAWLGDAEEALDDGDSLSAAQRKYDDHPFRVPLTEDWHWSMPDTGAWQISRLELGVAALGPERILVGTSRKSGLFVLDRRTGRPIRVVETSGPVQAQPVALDGDWFVADTFGQVQRLDSELAPRWEKPYQANSAVYRKPVVHGGEIFLTTEADSVVAIDAETGAWKWTHRRDVPRGSRDLAILGSPSPAVLSDGTLVVGFSDGWVLGLDPETGAQRWELAVGDGQFPDVQAEVIEAGGLLIAASFGGPVVAFDAETRVVRWTNDEVGSIANMAIARDALYVSGAKGRLWSLDPATGKAQWSWEPRKQSQLGPPVRSGGSILVGDVGGTLYAIDRFEGRFQWAYQPMNGGRLSGVAAAPAVRGRQVVFATAGGRLLSLVSETSWEPQRDEEPGERQDRVFGW